ncbi:MAG: N-acetyltransferase [Deltaproteobacteria bacterium]|jgi:UDP-2-acetamido-3-amino-2,3-dideoxy-glucuronate N-acetyltransferase|nr:N-acetyltransferase [Deltaproteobacteria bacterium]MBW2536470.1 N-acetyltransferase [Deltaproteobacteria bacterium]
MLRISEPPAAPQGSEASFVHASAVVDPPCRVGAGTKIWHFCHVMAGATIGRDCTLGQNVFVAGGAIIGDRVKIQNNVSVYDGVVIEDDVFLGPSAVLTNVRNPRAAISRRHAFETTLLRQGCTIGANATIVCGVTVGSYAFVAAGAVVTRDLPDHVLATGVPARGVGWMSHEGHRLGPADHAGVMRCPATGRRYVIERGGARALD